ncbi:restriction endonuclease subunit S [Staphylococcus coagulans]|uniref:restriction endonuclease subunit S n=1 Tax=Staphylococcus coagulans TaxID=74706 RepID=UPI00398039CC
MTNETKNVPKLRFLEFEKSWRIITLGEATTKIGSGKTPLGGSSVYQNNGIPFLRSQNIQYGMLDLSELVYIDENIDENMKSSRTYYGDVLLNITGASIGRSAVNTIKKGYANLNQHVCIIRLKEHYNYNFIGQFLISPKGQKKVFMAQNGGSREGLNFNEIGKIKFSLPYEVEEQQKIGDFFSKLDRQIELEEKKLTLLEQQKKGYMQKIFSQALKFKDENGKDYPEWEEKVIKDVYKVTRGYVLAKKLMSDTPNSISKYPVYSSQTGNNGLMGYYSDYLYKDAITWTTDGANAGSVSFRQGKFYCTNVCGVLLNELGNSNMCMAEMLNNIAFKYVSKVGNPKLMNNVMEMIKLKFPCLEEQQAISKFLNVFSEAVDNQNKKVKLLKERKKGFLQKMFV